MMLSIMATLASILRGIVYRSVYLSATAAHRSRSFFGRLRAGVVSLFVWPRAIVAGISGALRAVMKAVKG